MDEMPMIRAAIAAAMLLASVALARAQSPTEITVGYLHTPPPKSAISLIEVPAANDGAAGAELANDDNNTTGKFLNQHFALAPVELKDGGDPVAAIEALAQRGVALVLADVPADALLKAADAGKARGVLLFNVGATDDRLREEDCRADVIHVAPTRSMLADGLAQYL